MTVASDLGFRAAHAPGADWREAARACLAQLGPRDPRFTLGVLYVGDALAAHLDGILTLLRNETGVADWVGTIGMGVLATDAEYFEESAIAVMLAALPRESFHLLDGLADGIGDLDRGASAWIDSMHPSAGLVHGDPRNENLPDLIADLAERSAAFLVGGLSSSRGPMVQIAERVGEGVLSGVLFAPDLGIATGLSQGCSPLGPAHAVTDAQRNIVLAIEGRPALDVLRAELGDPDARALGDALRSVHVALPVLGSDTGDYLVRNLMGIDPRSGAIAIGAAIDPGQRLIFCRRDRAAAEEDLRRMLAGLRTRLDGKPPRGGIYVSCLARGPNLFGTGSREVGIIAEELGAFPMVGFFANGEISHNRLYGYTGVLTLFT